MALLAGFSIAGTHDYLAWNRKRWEILQQLTKTDHVPLTMIDGGFEFNGWYSYDDNFYSKTAKNWWWVQDDTYIITFEEVSGYQVVQRHSISQWLPPSEKSLFVLRRQAAATSAAR